jgi:hypothetical protein
LWIIFVPASCDAEQRPVSVLVLIIQQSRRAGVLFLEFALGFVVHCPKQDRHFVVHCPKQDRHFLCLRYASPFSAIKQNIIQFIVQLIGGSVAYPGIFFSG